MNKFNSKEKYVLVTDGIIEMSCEADSYEEATNLFLDYLKNQNGDNIYEFQKSGEIYEYNGDNLKTVHFIFNKHYIDFLRKDEKHLNNNVNNTVQYKDKLREKNRTKTGHWIDYSEEGFVVCSECGASTNCDGNINELHFCFSCGAMMNK